MTDALPIAPAIAGAGVTTRETRTADHGTRDTADNGTHWTGDNGTRTCANRSARKRTFLRVRGRHCGHNSQSSTNTQ